MWPRRRDLDCSDEPRISATQAQAMIAAGHQPDTVAVLVRGSERRRLQRVLGGR